MMEAELNPVEIRRPSGICCGFLFVEAIITIMARKITHFLLVPGNFGYNILLAYYFTGSSYTIIYTWKKCANELLFPTPTSHAQLQGLKDILEEETLAANSTDQPEQQQQQKKTPFRGALITRRGMIF